MSCSRTQHGGGRSRTPDLSLRSPTLYHWATALPSLPGQRLTSCWHHEITFATVYVTDYDVSFCDGPRMLIRKTAKPCINNTWIALLIHGFVLVKTWRLIACNSFLCSNLVWYQPKINIRYTGTGNNEKIQKYGRRNSVPNNALCVFVLISSISISLNPLFKR